MLGGPPCQAFSTAGARRAFNDARGNVFLKYLDLAAEIRPRYLVIENVRGLLSTGYPLEAGGEAVHGGALRIVLDRLLAMGYGVSFNLYNAANFGAPQVRERVVIIARRDGSVTPWLTPTNSADPDWGLPAWNTLGPVLDSVRLNRAVQGFPATWVIRGNLQDQYRQIGNAVPVALGEAIGRAIAADMRGDLAAEEADRYHDFPFSRYRNTSQETWRLC